MEKEAKTWRVITADGEHTVEFYPSSGFKPMKLLIDGEATPIAFKSGYSVVDMPILTGGGHDIRFVLKGKNNADISYDGVYMDSGDVYEPAEKMSTVNWITTIASGLAGLLGGLIPWLCALGGVALGVFVATNKSLGKTTRMILGILTALLTWGLAIGISILAGKGIRAAEKTIDKKFGKEPYSITLTRGFNNDNSNTDELLDEGFELIFAAYSDEAYAFAQSISDGKFKLLYDTEVQTVDEYILSFFDIKESDIKSTESGVRYFEKQNDQYTYVVSVCRGDGAFYETWIHCLNETAEKTVPKMIEWTDSITIASSGN